MLSSYRVGYEWTDESLRGARSVLESGSNPAEIWAEFMDVHRFGGPEHEARLYREYKEKYAGKRFDLVLSFDNAAFAFLMRHRQSLFPKASIVFCGLNSEAGMEKADRNLVTGLMEAFAGSAILEPAFQLHPQAKRVYMVWDHAQPGQARERSRAQVSQRHPGKTFEYLVTSELSMEEIEARLRDAPPDSLILMAWSLTDAAGRNQPAREAFARLAEATGQPVYASGSVHLGKGVIGWGADPGFLHGERAGRMALKVLQGVSPADIPIEVDDKNRFHFDYEQLQRWHIAESRLPPGSVVENKPDSVYERYKPWIWWGGAFGLVEGLVIAALVLAVSRRRKAESSLQSQSRRIEKNRRFLHAIIDNREAAIYVKDLDGRYLLANRYIEEVLQYPPGHMIGKTDYEIMPQEAAAVYRANDERVLRERRSFELEEQVAHPDGVHTYLSHKFPLLDEAGETYAMCGISTDITDRKRMEGALRESQDRYRTFIENTSEGIVRIEFEPGIDLALSLEEKVERLLTGSIAECNDAYARLYGFATADGLIGKPFSSLKPGISVAVMDREMENFFTKGLRRRNREFSYLGGGGETVHATSSGIGTVEEGKLVRYWGVVKDNTARKRAELGIAHLAQGVASTQEGSCFFEDLTKHLALAVAADYALICELDAAAPGVVQTRAFYADGQVGENFQYDLAGTPCANVVGNKICVYPEQVSAQFPKDEMLAAMGIESYVGAPMFDSAGQPVGLAMVMFRRALHDSELAESVIQIFAVRAAAELERIRVEDRLRESEQRFRTIVEHAPEAIVVLDCDTGRFVDANANAELMFGWSRAEMLEMGMRDLLGPPGSDDREVSERIRGRVEAALRGDKPIFETTYVDRSGQSINSEVRLVALPAEGRRLVLGTLIDIRERKAAEAELLASRESLRALSAHRETVREQERIRIAREIHDELGQMVTAMKMELSLLRKKREEQSMEDGLTELGNLMDATIVSVRRIATDLRPAVLDTQGLAAAVKWQVKEFERRTGIECRTEVDEMQVSGELATAAFRILQEALTNVARHAGARTVSVGLQMDNNCLRLSVADDGQGIPAGKLNGGKSLGLLGIRERAQAVNGRVEIGATAGGGTTVMATLPMPEEVLL